jgi:choline dehydrogenase-like flavoprotein
MNDAGDMTEPIDAIIVGSGAGCGTRVLTERGFNVVVLEKGEWWKAEDFLPFDELLSPNMPR